MIILRELHSSPVPAESVSLKRGHAPWTSSRPSPDVIWETAKSWVEANEASIQSSAGRMIAAGFTTPDEVSAEAVLLAFETLQDCVCCGRIDLFPQRFFSELKFSRKEAYRRHAPFFHRDDDVEMEELPDSRMPPERLLMWLQEYDADRRKWRDEVEGLTHVYHPRTGVPLKGREGQGGGSSVSPPLLAAFAAMTKKQRVYWLGVLVGEKPDLGADVERMVVVRSLARVSQQAKRATAAVLLLMAAGLGIPVQGRAADMERQVLQRPYHYADSAATVQFPRDHKTFIITDPPAVKAAKPVPNPPFLGKRVSASVVDTSTLERLEATEPARPRPMCAPVTVLFPLNQDKPLPGQDSVLEAGLQGCGSIPLFIDGHACDLGSAEFNRDLSRRRAFGIAGLLRRKGLVVEKVVGRGETIPNQIDPANRRLSRRVEITPAQGD